MLNDLSRLLDRLSRASYLFGGSGGRGGGGGSGSDDPDKEKESKDPFENFDFTRFKSSRPRPEGSSSSEREKDKDQPNESGQAQDDDRKAADEDTPPRRTGSPGANRPFGGGQFNFGNQFGGFGSGGQIPQFQMRMPQPGRGAIGLIILGLLIVALFILGPSLVGFWTDLMWYQEVGQTGVFFTRLWSPLLVFLAAFVLAFAVIMLNVSIARRFGPTGPVINPADNPFAVLLGGGVRFLNFAFIVGAVIISMVMAGAAAGNWQTILIFFNAAPWTDKETVFNNSIGFYVFEGPFYSFLQGWLVGLFVVALIAAMSIYFLRYSLAGRTFQFTPSIKTHASVMGAILLALFAFGYQISNWNLAYSPRGRAFGASATDVDAQFPANTILTFIVAAAAVLLIANIFIRDTRRGVNLLVAASAIWLVSHMLVGNVYPSVYQNFSVKPNEITKERPYIENTIKMTRKAYGLELNKDVTVVPFQGTAQLTQQDIQQNTYIQENARLWDYDKLRGIYDQTQTLRPYYDFEDIDIDRYNLDLGGGARKTQVMLGARELDVDGLTTKTWQSLHLQYTHGYGVQASPVNQVDQAGRPVNLITQSFPLSSTLLPVTQPRIYFGQKKNTNNYSVINTNLDEIDYPFQGSDEARFKYDGKGGIKLSNFFVKAAFAMKLGDFNLLISDAINDNSKLIFRRTVSERVQQIAPFLTYDPDPYLVVADGRLYWIQDAYTSTSRFPHSDPLNRRSADPTNYIRNSVKVVVDAYDGTTTFYLMNRPNGVDPIAQSYANIFPGLFKPLAEMPQSLRDHLRYPELLFRVQTQVYQTYHVTDPNAFYNNQDLWQIPADPRPASTRQNNTTQFEPYYLVTRLPGESQNEFVLINVFQPLNRVNLVSWMAARMDGDNYGQLKVYNFDPSVNVDGPAQFYSKLQALPDFSRQQSLLNSGTSSLPPGPIIIIPVDNSVLYVMPYYLQGTATALPQLQFVATGVNEKVYVSQPDSTNDDRTRLLGAALTDVFTRGQQVAVTPGQPGAGTTQGGQTAVTSPVARVSPAPGTAAAGTPAALPGATPGAGAPAAGGPTVAPGQQASIADLVRSIRTHQDLAAQAFAAGDTARGNAELRAANDDLARLNQLLGR